ncbi:MAG: glycosyltransferase family 39 protein [Candidatus Omnitrophota bacterium]
MTALLPYMISFLIGYLSIDMIFRDKDDLNFFFHLFATLGLGLALSSQIAFYSLVIMNEFHKGFVIVGHLGLLMILAGIRYYLSKIDGRPFFIFKRPCRYDILSVSLLALGIVPAVAFAGSYLMGGWDGWAVWNFKARFLVTAGQDWQNLFDPVLWRTSPHYPLLLPLMNAWAWTFSDDTPYLVPFVTSMVFTFATAGLLFSGLRLFVKNLPSTLAALVLLTAPIVVQMGTSQYSDIVLSYFLLASCLCLATAKLKNQLSFSLLSGLFLGFLSFSKDEGLVLAGILLILGIFYLGGWSRRGILSCPQKVIGFLVGCFISSLPTLLFKLVYAPANQTFINGLVSVTKPSTLFRFKMIMSFLAVELSQQLWNGLWIVVLIGVFLSLPRCVSKKISILPLLLLAYLSVVIVYYFTNTYFDIKWWLSVSLRRILFAILPVFLLWIFFSLFEKDNPEQGLLKD